MKKYFDRAIELLDEEVNEKNLKEYRMCLRRTTRKEHKELYDIYMRKADPEFYTKIKNDNNFKAKVIAAYVRYNIEDFHVEHLNDKQMKELNPLIRNAIYTALTDIVECMPKAYFVAKFNLPEYWEDCEYIET